jgi:indole-3-glycerol phosphate synthase
MHTCGTIGTEEVRRAHVAARVGSDVVFALAGALERCGIAHTVAVARAIIVTTLVAVSDKPGIARAYETVVSACGGSVACGVWANINA